MDASFLLRVPFAHRGYHDLQGGIPENSLPAFKRAVDHGYGIEIDVHLTREGSVVVFHDDDLQRMCGKDLCTVDLTTVERASVVLEGSVEGIPLLAEVLKMVAGRVPVLVELKDTRKVGLLEQAVVEILADYQGQFAVQAFNPFRLYWLRRHYPEVLRGQLSGDFRHERINTLTKLILRKMWLNKLSRPDFLSFDYRALPNNRVSRFKTMGLPVLGWTIRDEAALKFAGQYCDSFIFEHIKLQVE